MIPSVGDWPWLIKHNGHPAWYQRAVLIGDFAPGNLPPVCYILTLDGELPDPEEDDLRCGTCGERPADRSLIPVDRGSNRALGLGAYHGGHRAWPAPTSKSTCWLCNFKFDESGPHSIRMEIVAKAHEKPLKEKKDKKDKDAKDKMINVCARCYAHLIATSRTEG